MKYINLKTLFSLWDIIILQTNYTTCISVHLQNKLSFILIIEAACRTLELLYTSNTTVIEMLSHKKEYLIKIESQWLHFLMKTSWVIPEMSYKPLCMK